MTLDDLYRLLKAGHVQALGIVETIDRPLLLLDANLCVVNANPAFLNAFHTTRDETIDREITKIGEGQWDIEELTRLLKDVIPKSAALLGYEVTHDFPKIGLRTMQLTARRLVHPDNNSLLMLLVFDDVTQQRSEDLARDLILSEVEHRLKNFFGLVHALARQIPARGEGAADYRDALIARLDVLANAELALFSGAGNDIETLIATVTAPYQEQVKLAHGQRVKLSGPQLRPFSLVFHELATNAVKYGALSRDGGRVNIDWSIAEAPRRLTVHWREEGGPTVSSGQEGGFGTVLIRSCIKELGARIDQRYEADGLKATITVPLPSAHE